MDAAAAAAAARAEPLLGGSPPTPRALLSPRARLLALLATSLTVLLSLAAFRAPSAAAAATLPSLLPPPLLDQRLDEEGWPIIDRPTDRPRACWGIVSAGRIAHDFTAAAVGMGACVHAVAAAQLPAARARAAAFAAAFRLPRAYDSYAALAADPNVSMVYVAAVNVAHARLARFFLLHGKHVLLEKPATLTLGAFDELAAIARARRLLLVTNFWTRWFPTMRWARAIVHSGMIGRVVHVAGDMAFQAVRHHDGALDRFFNASLLGGATLDMGSYLCMYASTFLDASLEVEDYALDNWSVQAEGVVEGGVDTETAFLIGHVGGAHAAMGTSLKRASDFAVRVMGTHGMVHILGVAISPLAAEVTVYADASLRTESPRPCCGMPLVSTTSFKSVLPPYPAWTGESEQYPHAMGMVYVAAAFEECMYDPDCTELPELPLEEQRLLVQLAWKVLDRVGVYKGVQGV
ncbi:hypothetical protein AB1Y20_009577 [Prymnesium parvum]|uniref:D-xylose 1-dehydrogenase (NADP(+), D-xylono-1,5-lactone-forming) n=1 Tax=Prymnesium parvum TaxID=97485 RepID=A0AB34K4M6_PRYPA